MTDETKNPLKEIVQPFIDLVHAPRALWGINLSYFLEGMVYFGMLGYLAIHFSELIFQGMENANDISHKMVMVLTAGITISMFFLGTVADRKGVRFALISAFLFMIVGRTIMSSAPTILGLEPNGLWSPLHLVTMGGILFVVVGYGMYQPAAYAAVKHFTTPKTAAMGFAMLYAVMNLGGWLPSFGFLVRDENFLGLGITGAFWIYTGVTVLALIAVLLILTKKTVSQAIETAKRESGPSAQTDTPENQKESPTSAPDDAADRKPIPVHIWGLMVAVLIMVYFGLSAPTSYIVVGIVALLWIGLVAFPSTHRWIADHPLTDAKFFFFIFALIPVQTLFTYNWFVLPQYIKLAFDGWIGQYFEFFSNFNPLLIFVATPIIAAITQKADVYKMMIWGTFIMAAPAFLLVIGPHPWTLITYIVLMTIGEAMWQPRFLQYAAEIAPEGRTGEYMGVAQLPWFLTKVLVPWLYSGRMMDIYCPADGPKNTEMMWFIFACIAITSTVLLLLAKGWVGKDFQTKA